MLALRFYLFDLFYLIFEIMYIKHHSLHLKYFIMNYNWLERKGIIKYHKYLHSIIKRLYL